MTHQTSPLNKATIKTLRSIRHRTRRAMWVGLNHFDIVHATRLYHRGFIEIVVTSATYENNLVGMTDEGLAVLEAAQ